MFNTLNICVPKIRVFSSSRTIFAHTERKIKRSIERTIRKIIFACRRIASLEVTRRRICGSKVGEMRREREKEPGKKKKGRKDTLRQAGRWLAPPGISGSAASGTTRRDPERSTKHNLTPSVTTAPYCRF